jgi:uncharacterized protein involved in exopolysaccharide biosynthesis
MADMTPTPRDKLQRLVDLGRKSIRYWWLVAAFAVVGGVLSLTFVLIKPRKYQSYAVLFYQERIQSSLLINREEQSQRNIGDRYREMLLARVQLAQIVSHPELNPFPDERDLDVAIDKLRAAVRFEIRGASAFRITYTDQDPVRAKRVTEKLTAMIQERDESLRNEQARATVAFAIDQKEEAQADLRKHELALAEFLAKHPEFAQETAQGSAGAEGASIRAIRDQKNAARTGNSRLYALERQRQRIQARLDAPPDAKVRLPAAPTPEKLAANSEVAAARNELSAANRELDDARTRYTEHHPAMIKATERVANAQQRLRRAQSSVPADVMIAPTTEADRARLRRELAALDEQIHAEQRRSGKGSDDDASTNWVVQLETQHADLRRHVNEARERFESLASSVFRAQLDANQKLAETGGRLIVVDPAFKPVRPSGPGRSIFFLAGMVLFVSLGTGLAVGCAVIDDRVYRRSDLDALGLVVLAEIPRAPVPGRSTARDTLEPEEDV